MALKTVHSIKILTTNPRIPHPSLTAIQAHLWSLAPQKCIYIHNHRVLFSHLIRVAHANKLTITLENPLTCKSENTPKDMVRAIRQFIQSHHLDPHEVLTASSLHHSHLSLLYGHTPKDPNIKALAIIMQTVSYPGEFVLEPLTPYVN